MSYMYVKCMQTCL